MRDCFDCKDSDIDNESVCTTCNGTGEMEDVCHCSAPCACECICGYWDYEDCACWEV